MPSLKVKRMQDGLVAGQWAGSGGHRGSGQRGDLPEVTSAGRQGCGLNHRSLCGILKGACSCTAPGAGIGGGTASCREETLP